MTHLVVWPDCNAGYTGPQPRALVLDSNIVLDCLLFADGRVDALQRLMQSGDVRWIHTARQVEELRRVLLYPHLSLKPGNAEVLDMFLQQSHHVAPAQACGFVCKDRDDQHFLDLAAAHQAVLLSKDKQVLKMRKRMERLGVVVAAQLMWA